MQQRYLYRKGGRNGIVAILSILIILCSTWGGFAQSNNTVILGRVLDNKGNPLAGATIRLVGSSIGVTANNDGNFRLVCPTTSLKNEGDKKASLMASFIGMKSQTLPYLGQREYLFRLSEDTRMMKEVVVVARPNINAMDIRSKTGVIASVDMKELVSKPMIDLSSALQGSVPGLVVVNQGELGTKPEIRIRGNSSLRPGDRANEPLYVLDGQIISSEAFITLNPLDIREIKVLKDAIATALYGVKAANGVVEISSKRGTKGKMQVSQNTQIGITARGPRGVEMMKTAEKLELERRVHNAQSPGYLFSSDFIESTSLSSLARTYHEQFGLSPLNTKEEYLQYATHSLDSLKAIDTDWFRELIRPNYYQNYNLSLRGGTDELTYYVSGNYAHQGGQIEGNSSQRISGRMSLDWHNRWGYLSLSTNAGYSRTDSPNSSTISPLELVSTLNPYESRESSKLFSYPNKTFNDLLHQYSSELSDKRFGTTLSMNIKPFSSLQIDGVVGIDYLIQEGLKLTSPNSYEEQRQPLIARGRATGSKGTTLNYTSNLRLTYSKEWADLHDLTLSANSDYYYSLSDNLSATGYGLGVQTYLGATNKSLKNNFAPSFSSNRERAAQLGLGLALGYTYDQTYDFFLAYKADASSILPSDKRWSTAWASGLSLNIEQYGFMKKQEILTRLHLKGSVGLTSSLAGVSSASTIPIFSYNDNAYGGNFRQLALAQMYNRELKPETVLSTDLGVSLGFLGKYNLDAQVYRRTTKQALLAVQIASSNGFSTMTRNIGELENQGIELSLSGEIFRYADMYLNLRTSLAYNQNKVLQLYGGKSALYANEDSYLPDYEVGKPLNVLYGLQSLGIHPFTGLPIYLDHNGEEQVQKDSGAIPREDFVELGLSQPPYQGTIGLNMGWGNFSLDAQFYYVLGGVKAYNLNHIRFADDLYKNTEAGLLEQTWFERGDEGKLFPYPGISTLIMNSYRLYNNSRMVSSSNYLRLSMLSLNYRIPQTALRSLGGWISYASIAFQGSNLFTIKPYRGSNPEAGNHDIAVQPVYTLSMTLNF